MQTTDGHGQTRMHSPYPCLSVSSVVTNTGEIAGRMGRVLATMAWTGSSGAEAATQAAESRRDLRSKSAQAHENWRVFRPRSAADPPLSTLQRPPASEILT